MYDRWAEPSKIGVPTTLRRLQVACGRRSVPNRKGVSLVWRVTAVDNELPDEMVQCCAEVVDGVADDDPEAQRWWLGSRAPQHVLPAVILKCSARAVRLRPEPLAQLTI